MKRRIIVGLYVDSVG